MALMLTGVLPAQNTADTASEKPESAAPAPKQDKAFAAYRLSFTLNELEDGKTVNTRQYALNLVPGYEPSNELKIGTRVPVEAKQGEMQYIDVGTSIWSRMVQQGDAVELEVHADLSNFAVSDQSAHTATSMPLLRQLRINASTIATLGKPMVVGVVDDPNSKRQYQLEVTVTKLR
jgi:hypothetical protein